jgi:hypothetical protein
MTSLKKLVAIWMKIAPINVNAARRYETSNPSVIVIKQPDHTGTIAAGRVLGLAAISQLFHTVTIF